MHARTHARRHALYARVLYVHAQTRIEGRCEIPRPMLINRLQRYDLSKKIDPRFFELGLNTEKRDLTTPYTNHYDALSRMTSDNKIYGYDSMPYATRMAVPLFSKVGLAALLCAYRLQRSKCRGLTSGYETLLRAGEREKEKRQREKKEKGGEKGES